LSGVVDMGKLQKAYTMPMLVSRVNFPMLS